MRLVLFAIVLFAASFVLPACTTAPETEAGRSALVDDAQAALARMKADDPSLDEFLKNGYGYAIFPSVGKGGLVVGGAYGQGVVYEGDKLIGYADLTQATIGLQLGGQSYSELIVFQNEQALRTFTSGSLEFAAQASAVALKSGASADANYTDGVAVFTRSNAGLMYEASIGGQNFDFVPVE